MFGRRAVDLVKELQSAGPDALPPYNDEQVRLVIEEVQEHASAMKELSRTQNELKQQQKAELEARGEPKDALSFRAFPEQVMPAKHMWDTPKVHDTCRHFSHRTLNKLKQQREAELEARGEPKDAVSFSDFPEQSSAFIVHHTSILRNKRLLLIYTKERMDRIKRLRWQQRSLPDDIKINLSPQEVQWFSTYSRLLSDYMRRDKGIGMDLTLDVQPPKAPDMFVRVLQDCGNVAFSTGSVTLKKGSTHFLPRAEADHLIQEGVLAPSESGPIEAFTTPFDYI